MKVKKLLILITLVFVLSAAAFLKNAIQKRQSLVRERPEPLCNLTGGLDDSFISGIEIYKGADEKTKIILHKDPAGGWVVADKFGIKAKKERVDSLLKELKDLKGEVRAETREVFGDFAISDGEGLHIILKTDSDKALSHLVVSLQKPGWGMSFARLAEAEKVILTRNDVLSQLNLYEKEAKLDGNYFADLKVFSFDPRKIGRIEIGGATRPPFVLARKEGADKTAGPVWILDPPEPKSEIDPARVDEFLNNMVAIYAQEVLDFNLPAYGFDKAELRIKLDELEGGKPGGHTELEIGSYLEPQKAYYLKISPPNFVFRVPESFIQNLKKAKPHFLKP